MKHAMKLSKIPFSRIKNGLKQIEIRLNDEKRQKLKVNDEIEFTALDTNETLKVKITELSKFKTFKELYQAFDYHLIGHPEGTTLDDQLATIRAVYSKEEEQKYGVLAIHIQLLE